MLVGFARKFVGTTEDAEEIVQDFFCSWWDRRREIQPQAALRSYLFTSVRNRCLNRIEHLKVRQNTESGVRDALESWGSNQNPVQVVEGLELKERIASVVEELPDRCREVFVKSRYEGKKYSEIAAEMDISPRTVETQVGKALKILRGALRDLVPLLIWMLLFGGGIGGGNETALKKNEINIELAYGYLDPELSPNWNRWKT